MKPIIQNPDGTYTIVLYLKEDENKQMKKLAKKMELNDYDLIKYCLCLVSWWSKNQIEPDPKAV